MTSKRRTGADKALERQIDQWVQRQLAAAPELTVEQRELLRRVLCPGPTGGHDNTAPGVA